MMMKTVERRGMPGPAGRVIVGFVSAVLISALVLHADSAEEQIWHHRNLGKAFYENSATQYDAVGEFKKALDLAPNSARERVNYGLSLLRAGQEPEGIVELEKAQKQDPSIPHTWFNLGIAYKRASRYDEAITQFEKMVELVPSDAIAHYNLGVLYKLRGDKEGAIREFERSAKLDTNLAGPHFQLSTLYRQNKEVDKAKATMALFREIKDRNKDDAVPEDLEWSFFSEIYETIEPDPAEGKPAQVKLAGKTLAEGMDTASAGLFVFDADGDGKDDLLAFSSAGAKLYQSGSKAVASGLENVKGIKRVIAADVDNNGLADLCVLTGDGAQLYSNAGGTFKAHPSTLPAGRYNDAVWLDYDHDNDVDLFLLGQTSVRARNNGEAGFADDTAGFPFEKGQATAGARVDLIADTQGMDLVVSYADRGSVLYRDFLAGHYEARPLASLPQGAKQLLAIDIDNNGWTDVVAAGDSSVTVLLNNRKEGFNAKKLPSGAKAPVVLGDLENRGFVDVISAGGVFRNQGQGQLVAATVEGFTTAAAVTGADFDADGKVDLAAVMDGGSLELFKNTTASQNRWLSVALTGVKNMKQAHGAEIEVKAGSRYQKKIYTGGFLHFGLSGYQQADTVRITWPNGLIQNEPKQDAGQAASYEEAQRLSGSCPMIFTWNGDDFEFITDVLGVAPLGAAAGGGEVFPVDHDEVIQISGQSLVAKDGAYEIRITEELREIAFLDEIRLIAVDHPSDVDIFTNDKFKSPPFPEFRLFGASERLYPVRAWDHRGEDVLRKLTAQDQTYPDGYARTYSGVAEMHTLELDFGQEAAVDNEAVMILAGWVDWADGSTFLAAAQERQEGLVMPYLQVRDADGEWRTVIEDMGIPAGKPKTIAVDLTGKFLSPSREVRIVTNLCVYWDEIFLSDTTAPPQARLTDLQATTAELRFRGFSKVVVHPERKQPEYFVYADVRPQSMWNPTRGLYTRFGEVEELLRRTDDRFVIMGSGDELRLHFDASAMPDLPTGWRRDFLLFVDGWAKDGDANTAHSQTVGPLPYHDMPQYPYAEPHVYPDGPIYKLYQEFYNTRPALRLIRPLTENTTR